MYYPFWFSAAFLIYTYFGYPLLVLFWPGSRGWRRGPFQPSISFVIAVRNEAWCIEAKIRHLLSLDYPTDRREIIVVSDGSTDSTPAILDVFQRCGDIRVILSERPLGKAQALNLGVSAATGDIVVFNDARQKLAPRALDLLLENFADPAVGCASGQLHFSTEGAPDLHSTLYWKFERWLRGQESRLGACMGATGAFYAIRRSLCRPLPAGLLLDDVFTPLAIALRGFRVVHDARAVVWDLEAPTEAHEFRRKVRTLTGNYQLIRFLPGLLVPSRIAFQFFSHKIARLLAPLFLVLCLSASALLSGSFYRAVALVQCGFYALAVLGAFFPRLPRPLRIPCSFVILNAASCAAFINFLRGKTNVWSN